jgi:hypothetical protein
LVVNFTDPDPAKRSGSDRIRIRNTELFFSIYLFSHFPLFSSPFSSRTSAALNNELCVLQKKCGRSRSFARRPTSFPRNPPGDPNPADDLWSAPAAPRFAALLASAARHLTPGHQLAPISAQGVGQLCISLVHTEGKSNNNQQVGYGSTRKVGTARHRPTIGRMQPEGDIGKNYFGGEKLRKT